MLKTTGCNDSTIQFSIVKWNFTASMHEEICLHVERRKYLFHSIARDRRDFFF